MAARLAYDPKPLLRQLALAGFESEQEMARCLGVPRQTIHNWHKGRPVSSLHADRAACRLGLVPSMLWGDFF